MGIHGAGRRLVLLYLDSRSNGGKISPVKLHDYVLCNVENISEIERGIEFNLSCSVDSYVLRSQLLCSHGLPLC